MEHAASTSASLFLSPPKNGDLEALSHLQLDYRTCTTEELRKFIKDRTGKEPDAVNDEVLRHGECCWSTIRGWSKSSAGIIKHGTAPDGGNGPIPQRKDARDNLIKRLRHLDANSTFRFMDLAPELRLGVYDQLLTFKPGLTDVVLWPQISATSKRIHNEAQDILDKTRRATFVMRIRAPRSWTDFVRVNYEKLEKWHVHRSAGNIYVEFDRFPDIPDAASRILLKIDSGKHKPWAQYAAVSRQVYYLATKLHTSRPRDIVVKFSQKDTLGETGMLYPLHMLDSNTQVQVTCAGTDYSEYFKDYLRSLHESVKPTGLIDWLGVKQELDELRALYGNAGLDYTEVARATNPRNSLESTIEQVNWEQDRKIAQVAHGIRHHSRVEGWPISLRSLREGAQELIRLS